MADNEELKRALADYPMAKQPGENWWGRGGFLARQAPDSLATMLMALSAVRAGGPRDVYTAWQKERAMPTVTKPDLIGEPVATPVDPGITGGQPDLGALQRQATLDMGYGPNLHKDFAPRRGMLRDDPEYRYSSQGMMDRRGMQSSQDGFLGRRGTADPGYEQAVAERAAANELVRALGKRAND